MPKSSNNAEVENVLSAIRRLIVEGRPEGRAPAPQGRLVLTPALRVVEPAEPLPLRSSESAPSAPGPLILRQAVPPPATDAAPDPTPAEADPQALLSDAPEPVPAEPEPVMPDSLTPQAEPESSAPERHPAEASEPQPIKSEPLVLLNAIPSVPDLAAPPADVEPTPRHAAPNTPEEPLSVTGPAATPMPDPQPAASLALAPDPAFTRDPPPLNPPAPEPPPTAAEEPRPPAPALDETALRALVVEVLQKELRGEMGERMTRNLLKLVRREVAQALSASDRA